MIRIIAIAILFLSNMGLIAQEEFSQTINSDIDNASAGFSLEYFLSENNLIIQTGTSCSEYLVCVGLTKVDDSGNLIWSESYTGDPEDITYDDIAGGMLVTADNNIAITGSLETDGANKHNYFLMLTDIEGDSLWLKTYPNVGPDLAKVLAQMPDGGYLIGGTNGYNAERDIRLIRTDSEGEMIWEKLYESQFFASDVHSINIENNGDILIGGQVLQEENEDSDAYLTKISDENEGEMIWEAFWGSEINECPARIRQVPNENAYIVSWCEDDIDIEYDVLNRFRKIDDDLNILWEYDFPIVTLEMKQLTTIQLTEDGSTIGIGILKDDSYFDYLYDTYDKLVWRMVWMFKINPDGELEWERVFYDSDYVHSYKMYDILQTPDGSIYTVGQTTDSLVVDNGDGTSQVIYDQNIWLVRFDENGCFNGDCGPDNGGYWDLSGKISTSVDKPSSRIEGLSVYPNPSSGIFRLDLSAILLTDLSYQVYDVSGRLVKEKSIAGNSSLVEIDLSAFEQGVYFLQLYEEEELIGVERLVCF